MTPGAEREMLIRQDERKKVYDELGVLHGEAARVFNEYLEDPEIHSTPESREIIARARELAKKHDDGLIAELYAETSIQMMEREKRAAINEERAKALKKLTRIQFMVKHAWEGDRDTNPPDLGDILKFVEGFIAELRQQSGEQQREEP